MRRLVLATALSAAAGCSLLVDTAGLDDGVDAAAPEGGGPARDAVADVNEASAPDVDAAQEAGTSDGDTGALPAYVAAVRADGPATYLRLEEKGGAVAKDEMGHVDGAYVGTITFGAPGAFPGSTGISLNGDASGVSLGTTYDFAGRAPFTIEVWYKPARYDDIYRFLASKEGSDGAGRETYGVYVQQTDGLAFERYVNGTVAAAGGALPSLDAFHHVVAAYDGTTMRCFVDDVLVDTANDTRDQPTKPVPLWIGRQAADAPAVYGVVDEVAIYDKSLSAPQVHAHYAAAGR